MIDYFFLLTSIISPNNHVDYEELYFTTEGVRLIEDYSEDELDNFYSNIERKFWGYSSYIINDNIECDYVVNTGAFSYINDSTQVVDYDLTSEASQTLKTSIQIDASLGLSGASTIKKINSKLNVDVKAKVSAGASQTTSTSEKFTLKVDIEPHTKVTLKKRGQARLTSGVSKRFIGFVNIKSGSFEIIEPITENVWLVEDYL